MSRQLLYYSYWHTLLRKISDELPATWVTRSLDTDIWIECLKQYLKSLWREVSASALRIDKWWFECHKALCVALKILLNLFRHEFWQIDTVCLAAFRHIFSQKHCILDIPLTIYDVTDFERRYLTRSESYIVWEYDYKTISCWVTSDASRLEKSLYLLVFEYWCLLNLDCSVRQRNVCYVLKTMMK